MNSEAARKVDQKFTTYPLRSYPKGQILLFAGENPNTIFYLVKGKVRKYDVTYRGNEVAVNIFKPPSIFPMSWVINKTSNHYFYKTEEATQVHVVPIDDVLVFLNSNPDVMVDMISHLYAVINGLQGRVVQLMAGTAKSRLLYELVVECRRFGTKNATGDYVLSTNESDLAARSGLSRETVNRELSKLKAVGLVTIRNRIILIHDFRAIEKKFGGDISI